MQTNGLMVFGCRGHPALAQGICREIGCEPGAIEIFEYGNDNTFVRVLENVREADVFVVQTSRRPVNQSVMELFITIDALRRASAARVTAVVPYFPYMRSDKKDQPRVAITARLVADLLATAGADRVLTLDLHADQIGGFFSIPSDHLTAIPDASRPPASAHGVCGRRWPCSTSFAIPSRPRLWFAGWSAMCVDEPCSMLKTRS